MSIDQTSTFAPRLPPFQTTHCDDDVLVLDRRMPDRTVPFLGIDFDPLSRDALLARVIDGANRVDGFRYCVTPNVDQMVRLASYPQNRTLYQDAWLVVNDSRILELLAGSEVTGMSWLRLDATNFRHGNPEVRANHNHWI
mgnify:CR=1 FL=1